MRTQAAREWLLKRILAKKRWFRGPKLQNKSFELIAALGGLASTWRNDPRAAGVLRLAANSNDPDIRAAVAEVEPT
jgi:hypothetical protein